MRTSVGALAALVLLGCASFQQNPKLSTVDADAGYRLKNLERSAGNSEETFVILTLSGGGTRAAALAYGVLRELRDTPIAGGNHSLLQEVDVISSVSGGSFAAAYFGLYGSAKFFAEFPKDVLHRKLQTALYRQVAAPWNWPRLWSPRFGRSDLVNIYYAKKIFGRATYSEVPRRRPLIILNATDLGLGAQFSFTQEHFDRICSDLAGVQLSRAVLSSSTLPGAFTPVTWRSYRGEGCDYTEPPWVELALGDESACDKPGDPACRGNLEFNPRSWDRARMARAYAEPRRRYIHLVDGGVADNIGLRGPIDAITSTASEWTLLGELNNRETSRIKRVVVITVDAKPRKRPHQNEKASPPKILSVLAGAASRPMANYSTDTVELLRGRIREWDSAARTFEQQRGLCDRTAERNCAEASDSQACQDARRDQCYRDFNLTDSFRPPHPEFYRVHVRFDAISDPAFRRQLQELPTSLQLPRNTVEQLIDAGAELLKEASDYRRLVHDLS